MSTLTKRLRRWRRERRCCLKRPVCPDLASGERLAQVAARASVPVLMGYTWRWWPPLIDVRRQLADGAIGTVRHVQFHMSAHLADWHPWERYQDFFMARRELGGGALLDESHWIDLMLWLVWHASDGVRPHRQDQRA